MIKIEFDAEDFKKGFKTRTLEARVETNVDYFTAVDKGRSAVRPVRAKALRFPVGARRLKSGVTRRTPAKTKGFIFRTFVGPTKPQNLSTRALSKIQPFVRALTSSTRNRRTISTAVLAEFVNRIASRYLTTIRTITPVRFTGRLKSGYKLIKAK